MALNNASQSDGNFDNTSTVRQVISVFLVIMSSIGNALVVCAIYRFRSLRTVSNLIILNLSITDLLFSIITVPVTIFLWSENKLTISSGLCAFAGVTAELLCIVSIYTLVFISVERFLATNYPLKHRSTFTKKAVKIGILIIWVFVTIQCGITFLTTRYVYMEKFYHCMLDFEDSREAPLVLFHLGYLLPLLVLVCCNVLIVKAVLKSRRFVSEHAAASPRNNVGFCKEHRTSLLTITIIVMFLMLWTPYCIAASSLAFKIFSLPKELMSTSLLLGVANASVNPLIYGVMNKNFRIAFKKIMVCERN